MTAPTAPDAETCEQMLVVLGQWIARGGAERFLMAPVAPCEATFPEPWQPTRAGARALIRRLAWHAGLDRQAADAQAGARAVAVDDRRHGAPPTQRRPETSLELVEVSRTEATFALFFLGEDDVVGTFAHEIGVWWAALNRPDATTPYRTAAEQETVAVDPDRDLERGSIATVYLGLGVLAANSAYQQYSRAGRFNGAYSPLEYDVVRAGYLPMSGIAYLLAVQAVVRGDTAPPSGLERPQRDEVSAWMAVLDATELRERLGIPQSARGHARGAVEPFPDIDVFEDGPRKDAFRWRAHRGGVGMVAGGVLGAGVALLVASRSLAPVVVLGAAGAGHIAGRRVRVPRCTACASVVASGACQCPKCGARLHGDITELSERLDAEEHLDSDK